MFQFGVEDLTEETGSGQGSMTVREREARLPANLSKSDIATDSHIRFAAGRLTARRAFQAVRWQTARFRWNVHASACNCEG